MHIRTLLATLALALIPAVGFAQEHQHGGDAHAKMEHPVTVVIVVRHAEKAAEPANDPPLTAVGQERARALAALLADAKVGAVLHTPTTRTRDTARPVAEQFGLTPEVVRLGPMASHAQGVAEAVRAHPGKTIVVVGHSNTIMSYIAALGGPQRSDLCDHQYDGIYTLVIAHGEVRLVEGRYGPPNPSPTQPCGNAMAPPTRP
jgi:broad specificity phosphatase PhoE